MRAVCSFAT